MGHHDPKHLQIDLREMNQLNLDDVLLAAQENDFIHFNGKIRFTPQIAREHGLRPLVIFWGALNLFGGGRSSQFLLENPQGFQVGREGQPRPQGCYVNPICISHIQGMIDTIAGLGFEGYFIDEPTPLRDCFCAACQQKFEAWYGGRLGEASAEQQEAFRQRCVIDYIQTMADYCKTNHPGLETMCCLMPVDQAMWEAAGRISSLDNLGTDIYWVNDQRNVEEMRPLVREMAAICRRQGKVHHEWLQCWRVKQGREPRIFEQGHILIEEAPDALYIWAWSGQIGTGESCDDPERAWAEAGRVLQAAKGKEFLRRNG
jgi:hypothetical protein